MADKAFQMPRHVQLLHDMAKGLGEEAHMEGRAVVAERPAAALVL
jgi:hypothetical protein